jgi:tetratricopeptide (TPR) repeat protein
MTQNDDTLPHAMQLLQTGRFDEALKAFEAILSTEPENRPALINAGICNLQTERYAAAAEYFNRASLLDTGDAENWALLGYASLGGRRFHEAVHALRKALEIAPDSIQYLEMLADAFAGAEDPESAISTYETLARFQPDNPLWPGRLGLFFAKMGDRERAIPFLEGALGPTKDEFEFRVTLGQLLMVTEEFARIKPHFDVCVALMKQALESGQYDTALQMETSIRNAFIRHVTSEDHGAACFAEWSAEMTDAGRKAALKFPPYQVSPSDVPLVGFFLHRGSEQAHVNILLSVIEGMGPPENRPIRPRIYVFHDSDEAFREECRRLDLPLVVTDDQWPGGAELEAPFQRLLWLRRQLETDGVEALVWITSPTFLSFAAALRMAPVQVFWAMRYHDIYPPEIDGFITLGPLFRDRLTFHGHEWRAHPLVIGGLLAGVDDAEVAKIRATFTQYDTILGTFARTEKLADPLFLEGVSLTLKANPAAGFLWSGQIEDPTIVDYFRNAGIADRCHYLGWVNTALYAKVIDIFMDTAPAGCGVTAMQAMAGGKPIVAFDADWTMWGENVTPILTGDVANPEARKDMEALFALESDRPLLSRADSPAAYAAFATRLIEDEAYRKAVGDAGGIFCDRYLGNTEWNASIVTGHLLDIIQETRDNESRN